jgi:hypothetical protein
LHLQDKFGSGKERADIAADLGPDLPIGVVGKKCGQARAAFDSDLNPLADQPLACFGDKRDASLARPQLFWNCYLHGVLSG